MGISNGNQYRGELMLELAGVQLRLRPTFQAMASAEGRLGKSLAKVFNDFQVETDLRIVDVATIISEFAAAAGHAPAETNLNTIGELVRQEGVTKLFMPILKLLSVALSGQVLDDSETWLNKRDLAQFEDSEETKGNGSSAIGGH